MEDNKIIDLYWKRSETAISETSKKYGKYCSYIAYNILHDHEDCEECVNDTYMRHGTQFRRRSVVHYTKTKADNRISNLRVIGAVSLRLAL